KRRTQPDLLRVAGEGALDGIETLAVKGDRRRVVGRRHGLGRQRGRNGVRRRGAGGAAAAVHHGPPSLGSLDPIGEVLGRRRGAIRAVNRGITERETLQSVGRDTDSNRGPPYTGAGAGGIGADGGEDAVLPHGEPAGHRHHHVRGEHRRQGGGNVGSLAGGGEGAVGGEELVGHRGGIGALGRRRSRPATGAGGADDGERREG